jgi:hypothetical protein
MEKATLLLRTWGFWLNCGGLGAEINLLIQFL